jgi:hypothetical protein
MGPIAESFYKDYQRVVQSRRCENMRILVWLVIFSACICFSCNNREENDGTTVERVEELCTVTKNISAYDGRIVRVKALIRGFHSPLLYSEKCDGIGNVILLEADRESYHLLLDEMRRATFKKKRSEITGEIVLEGRIEKDQGSLFDYEFDVQPVPSKNTGKVSKLLTVHRITSIKILHFKPILKSNSLD